MMPPGLQALDVDCFRSAEPGIFTQILKTILETPLLRLTSISISDYFHPPDVQTLASVLRPQSNLEKLELCGFRITTESLATFGCHARLTDLNMKHSGESLQTVVELFGIIGSLFPKLRRLKVQLDRNLEDEVGISALAGIGSCSEIRRLVVSCSRSENLTSRMVSDMGRWWPSMERFGLELSQGWDPARAGTPLSILNDIARVWATTLQYLGIAFGPGDQLLPVPESPRFKFQGLQAIQIPPAPLSDDRLVNMAEFLAAITTHPLVVQEHQWIRTDGWAKVNRLIREIHQQHESKAEKSSPL
ncbi:hypothetical protein FRC04_002860 [Tulasnella sp. 424]|nr:hypothetical protein FRC04_002860 [Tulasnella sp. 424]